MAEGFDYVIVGGGTAGCVLAARLTENPATRVCLLEAGGRDTHPLIHVPVGFAKMTTGPLTWGLTTAPQKHANNREIPYAQARVLGGGSSINAEVFTRGHPADYDRWVEEGAAGWSFNDIRKYFLRSEGNSILSGEWHGTEGPLGVSNTPDPQPDDPRLPALLPGTRDSLQSRLQRPRAGRRRRLPDHDEERPPLLRRRGLPAPRSEAPEPHGRHQGAGAEHRVHRQPRYRRPLCGGGQGADGAGRERGHRHLGRHRLAQADDALGRRPGRPSAPARDRRDP